MKNEKKLQFRLLTLNCWFTPRPFTKDYSTRLNACIEKLLEGENDIVCFQEIWYESTYEAFRCRVSETYPHTRYFGNRIMGSGLALFSKFPILQSLFVPFRHTGEDHKVVEWICGKGIGFASIQLPNREVLSLFMTHLHAEYHFTRQIYHAFMVSQMFQLAEFTRNMASALDAKYVVLAGDLNSRHDSHNVEMLSAVADLQDSVRDNRGRARHLRNRYGELEEIATNNRPESPYREEFRLHHYPIGEKLDYIMYRTLHTRRRRHLQQQHEETQKGGGGNRLVCLSSRITWQKIAPDSRIHYSDHEAVEAVFTVETEEEAERHDELEKREIRARVSGGREEELNETEENEQQEEMRKDAEKRRVLYRAIDEMQEGVRLIEALRARYLKAVFVCAAAILLALLFCPSWLSVYATPLLWIGLIVSAYEYWIGWVSEANNIRDVQKDMVQLAEMPHYLK